MDVPHCGCYQQFNLRMLARWTNMPDRKSDLTARGGEDR